ncbi:MAG TPA: ABC transporter permease [Thermoanaerobaculia bacterium]|jgi:ABC-2 type transport system permease protein|nr:ABC transporter permease [Thermoanaerobaculia bacterium]
MRLDSIRVVAKREYLQRIKGKAFWLATLVIPLFLVAVTVVPSLLLSKAETRQRVVVVDATGQVAGELQSVLAKASAESAASAGLAASPKSVQPSRARRGDRGKASFDVTVEPPGPDRAAQRENLDRRVRAGQVDAWIGVDPAGLAGNRIEYHARNVSNFVTQEVLRDALSTAIRRVRLRQAGFDPERIGSLTQPVDLDTVKIGKEGSRAEEGLAGFAFAYLLFMMLYMVIAIWGQQVMTGVLEEKGSRIVEVLVATVRPFDLLMGKLVGICCLGLTQITIWFATLIALTAPGVVASLAFLPAGMHLPTVTFALAINFAIYFVLGFFVFATFYAAIGAAFNNVQEAQQVAAFVIFFLIAPLFIMFRIVNDPDSTLAVVSSLIPPFTPLLMTLRIALQPPPLWQILLSYVLTVTFIWGMIWLAARVYRTGILMYGKKPTLQEIWRWVRYA